MDARLQLQVNGEARAFGPEVATVEGLLVALGLADRRVAVEVNQRIVKRGTYAESALADGDVVEIVQFVGGGC